MKTKLQLLVFLVCGMLSFAQLRPIAKEVNDYHSKKVAFQPFNLFSVDASGKNVAYQKAAKDLIVLKLNKSKLSKILSERPEAMEFTFPFENQELILEMVKVDIYSPEFKIETNKRKVDDYKKGVFYRGIIKGDDKSVVAFSFFDNDVVGVASASYIGNVTLGKAKNSEDFVVYNDQKLTGTNPFICSVDELMDSEIQKVSFNPKTSKAPQTTNNCVRVYYEICYQPYQQNGSDVVNTVNWLSAIHNNINTLYVNEGVKMSLKTVFVWETADPYTGTYNQNLAAFRANRPTFDGDLAHLVNYPSTTSVAYLNSLCSANKYAYSGIDMTYNNVPTYSWTVMAMTHEMGHSLGSPHTHACSWNGNDSPIDWCGPTARPAIIDNESLDCTSDVIPENGGTIMSYCHLMPNVGINMSLGFGEQPGALIRQTVDSKACLGTDCVNVCAITVTSLAVSELTKTGFTVAISDVTSSQWKYKVTKMDGTLIKSGITDVKSIIVNNLSPATFYKVEVGTDCSGAFQKSQIILTDDDWCGKMITDSGGGNGNYTNGENWTKTFYPDNANQKVKITFQEFDLEQGYDILMIRNGTATSPTFTGAANLSGTSLPPSYQSTHPTGAITIIFRSDLSGTAKGFKAVLSCEVLAVDDISGTKEVLLSPNPVKNQFTLKGISNIKSVEVYDLSGKLLKRFDDNSLSKNIFDVNELKAGNYVVKIKTDQKSIDRKIVKE